MKDQKNKKRLLTKRFLPVTLVTVLLLSIVSVGFGTIGADAANVAQGETVYFNLSKNSSWYTNGNGTLYARFYSGNTPVGDAACSMQEENIYKATAPAAADSVRLAVYFDGDDTKDMVLALSAPNRVFFDNASANWAQPYVYNWKDESNSAVEWPGTAMTNVPGSSLYYYDITDPLYKHVTFNNNSGSQTPDLTVPGDLAYWNGNGWTEVFTKSTSKLDLSSKPSDANEIYLDGTNLVLSRYQYPNHNNLTTRQIYVYNPNWTGDQVSVFFDLSDPYQKYVTMTKVTTDPDSGKTLPAGYYTATVPVNAYIKFYATAQGIGGSDLTKCPNDAALNCYKMSYGVEQWVRFADAPKTTANFFADKQTTGENNADAFWVDAVYYDYMSDTELRNGWLKPGRVGTKYNKDEYLTPDDWYPFKDFNAYISNNTSGVTYPLYFGNFCNTAGAYPIMYDSGQNNLYTRNGGYAKEILKYRNFSYIANNSNGFFINGASSSDYNYSVQGLARSTLNTNGDIVFPNGTKMPYFQQTTADAGYAKSVQSYFPFRSATNSTTGVTRYTFNSKNATDNVFFKWQNSKPVSVNYSQGTGYGIKDGLADFNYPDYYNNQYRGYGIFPFNNNSGKWYNNPGNGNINYGFGVRMDMNFRVPANGTLDGTTDGEAVKFSFTGDDDLWVYLSPFNDDGTIDYSKSQLALDLGGAHKEASGNINFKTMQSTVSKGAVIKTDSNVNEKTMLVADSKNWGLSNIRIWAWKEGQNGRWYYSQGTYDGKAVFRADQTTEGIKLGDNDYFKFAKGNWEAESPTGSNSKVSLQGHFGRITYTDNPEYTPIDESYRWRNTATNKTTTLNRTSLGVSDKLDPTKLYHMTVFYMERGLIESNCSMEFTMTPAQNDYKVEKIVDTSNVNSGVAELMEQKDSFNFTTSGTFGKEAVNRTTSLTDKQVQDYDNRFDTDTVLQTSETGAVVSGTNIASDTEYTTSWSVADSDAGELIAQSATNADSKSTNNFVLKRKDGTNDSIHLKSTFVNTPVTDDVTISKEIIKEDGSPSDKIVTFNYNMLVDLDGSGSAYTETPYPLDYTVGGHAAKMGADGSFSFRSDQTVIIPNLPKNATFTVYELPSEGFTAAQEDFTGTVGSLRNIQFTNVEEHEEEPVTIYFALPKTVKAADAWQGADFYYNSANDFTTATKIPMTKTDMIVPADVNDSLKTLVDGNLDVYKVELTEQEVAEIDQAAAVGFSKTGATDRTGMRSGKTIVYAATETGEYAAEAASIANFDGKTFVIDSAYDEAYETKSYTGHWTSAAGVPTVTLKFAVPKGNTTTYNWGAADFYYSTTNNINDATRIPMENTGKVINATADNCSTLKDGQWSVYTVSLTEAQASAVDASKAAGFVKHGDKQNRTGMGAGNTVLNATTTAGSYNSNKAAVSTFNGKTFIIDSYYNTSYPNQTYKGYWSSDQGTTPTKTSTIYFAAPYAEKSSTDWTSGVDFYYSTTTNINDATRVAMTKTDKVYAATSELSTLQSGEWPVYKVDLTAAQVAAAGECLSVGFVKADSTKRTGLRPAYSVVNATDNGYESTGADISDFTGKIFVINGAYDAKYENTTYTGHWVDYSQATSKTESITLRFAVPFDWSGAELYYNNTQSMTGATIVEMTATNNFKIVNVNGSLKNVQSGYWRVYEVTLNSDQITAIDKSVSVGFKKAGSSSVRTGLRKAYSIANATTTNNYATYSAPIKNFNGKVFCIYNCYDAGNESGTYTGRWES